MGAVLPPVEIRPDRFSLVDLDAAATVPLGSRSPWVASASGRFSDRGQAVEMIDRDHGRHARAARAIAEEHFEARIVIARMLDEAGLA